MSYFQIRVFLIVILYNAVVGYQCFGGPYSGCRWRQHYTVSQPRRLQLKSPLLWKAQIFHVLFWFTVYNLNHFMWNSRFITEFCLNLISRLLNNIQPDNDSQKIKYYLVHYFTRTENYSGQHFVLCLYGGSTLFLMHVKIQNKLLPKALDFLTDCNGKCDWFVLYGDNTLSQVCWLKEAWICISRKVN
jgi:hypothetical protein